MRAISAILLFLVGLQNPISVDVPLVSVDVIVVDSQGKSVTNLNRFDFDVLEDGVPQTIKNFSPVNSPYDIVILLDCSDSTRDRLTLVESAMARFIDQLRTSDRLVVAAFGDQVHTVLDWSSDRKHKINLDENPICKGTDFYRTLDWGVRKLNGSTGRRGVVVFSDGFHTDVARKEIVVSGNKVMRVVPPAEDRDFQRVLKKVREAGAPFYFVAVDTDLNPGREYNGPISDLQQIRARMEQLAEASGGRIVFPRQPADVVPLFLQIGRELGSSYSLTYIPPHAKDGKNHTIDVRVRGENYKVQQSRKGYTGDPN